LSGIVCHEVTGYYEHVKEKYHVQFHIDIRGSLRRNYKSLVRGYK
jgi:hypothetical protein